jgi:hypothetical protein
VGVAPIRALVKHAKRPVITALVLTYRPLQPRRKWSLSGGSAAKVFEPRPQKTKSKNSKAGRVLRRPSGGLDFREFGDVGVAFSLVTFFWRSKRK